MTQARTLHPNTQVTPGLRRWFVMTMCALALACGSAEGEDPVADAIVDGLTIPTTKGPVVGVAKDDVRTWLGIPYAAPPTGTLRFSPPQPHEKWTEDRQATAPPPACAQVSLADGAFLKGSSEDCLYLNVYAPDPAPKSARPVIVWLHGGLFVSDHASNPLYDPTRLVADENLVVVAVNARLGAFGYAAFSAAEAGSSDNVAANAGLLDQVRALAWVKDNIALFGGDPNKVTVMGQGSGGRSVCGLLTTPDAADLFGRVIIQSGGCGIRWDSAKKAAERTSTALAAAGCGAAGKTLSCARGLSTEALAAAGNKTNLAPGGWHFGDLRTPAWQLWVDGKVIPTQPSAMFGLSQTHLADVLIGTNAEEGRLFVGGPLKDKSPTDDASYLKAIGRRFGNKAHDVVDKYPPSAIGSHRAALQRVTTDAMYTCPARRTAKALSKYMSVRRYHFEVPTGATKTTHEQEVPWIFGTTGAGLMTHTAVAASLQAQKVRRMWANFATTGNPDLQAEDTEAWPTWFEADPYMKIDPDLTPSAGLRPNLCDFWDSLPFHEETKR